VKKKRSARNVAAFVTLAFLLPEMETGSLLSERERRRKREREKEKESCSLRAKGENKKCGEREELEKKFSFDLRCLLFSSLLSFPLSFFLPSRGSDALRHLSLISPASPSPSPSPSSPSFSPSLLIIVV